MDYDNEESGGLALSCNVCAQPVQTMYKSACNHIYCTSCCEAHFSKDPHCPVDSCGVRLTQKHITGPIDVGVTSPESLESALYKNVFSSALLQDIILNALNVIPALENVLTLVSSQTYLEVARAQRARFEIEQKYKKMKRNVKAAEQDYRNRLAAVEGQLKTSESYKRKFNDQVGVLQQQLDDLARKNKSMEQVLVKLRAEGHTVPSIHSLPTPVSTPPPQYHNPPPMALPSPRLSSSGGAGGHSRHSSSNAKGGAYYRHQQHQQQQQQHYMQQQQQQQQQHQQRGRSPSPSPHLAARPASYGGPGLALPPGTPNSSTGSYHRRGGSAGPQGIPGFGGGGGGGGGGLARLLSPHRNAAAVVSSSSSSGPFGGGYPQQQQRSPSPGYGLGMRY